MADLAELEKEFDRVHAEAAELNRQIMDLLKDEDSTGTSHHDMIAQFQEAWEAAEDRLTLIGRQLYGHAAVEMGK